VVCDGKGLPLEFEITPGQAHESKHFETVIEKIEIKSGQGRPRKRPENIAGDKGYSCSRIRDWIKSRNVGDVIPTKDNEKRNPDFDKALYRERNFVERCIGWLKESRRIATRYEKLAVHFSGMLRLAMVLEYL
jgi:transposase